jgi:hypothetical protein
VRRAWPFDWSGTSERIGGAGSEFAERYLQLRARTIERWSIVGPGVSEDPVEPKVGDALEMPDVACYELEVVIEGGRSDLYIGVGEDVAALLKMSAYLAEHASDGDVVRKGGYRWENTFLDVL